MSRFFERRGHRSPLINGAREAFRGRPTIGTIVFDSPIFVRSTRIVAGGEDETSKGLTSGSRAQTEHTTG